MEYLGYVTGGIDFGPDIQYGEFKASAFCEIGHPYHLFPANRRLASTQIYSSIWYEILVKRNDWYILAGDEERIVLNNLNRNMLPRQ